jgi:transposase
LFHHNKPILSGIDSRTLYCYLLASENRRDEETWAIHLLETKSKGLNPARTIGDNASGLVSGHKMIFPGVPYDYDNFHLSRSLMDLRRFYRNRLKSTITELNTLEKRSRKSIDDTSLAEQVLLERKEVDRIQHISGTINTLVS